MEANSFLRGLRLVPYGKAADVRNAIMSALSIKRQAFYKRRDGLVKHSPAERAKIEEIFVNIGGIPKGEIWGN